MRALYAFVFVALVAGCSTSRPAPEADAPSTPPASAAGPTTSQPEQTDRLAALEALYWQRVEERRGGTEADVAFMQGMIGHHAQALIMADMAARNGAGPAVRRLAARIDNAQKDEILSMQTWLRDRGHPYPEVHIEGTRLMLHMTAPEPSGSDARMNHQGMDHSGMDHSQMDHGAMSHDHSQMPGMLTQAQLDELDAARGTDFDRLFLAYMIGHHSGAVVMVEDLFAQDGAAQDDGSFKLASDIQVDQRTEIARMQRMLDDLAD